MTENNTDNELMVRKPPQNIESEQSLLGALLLNNTALDSIVDIVKEHDFYRRDHRTIYGAIVKIIQKGDPADVVTVHDYLKNQGQAEDCGGLVYLNELMSNSPSAANIKSYARIVHEKSILRSLISIGDEMITMSLNPEGRDVDEILAHSERAVMAINEHNSEGKRGFRKLDNILSEVTNKLADLFSDQSGTEVTGVKTYYPNMDRVLSGLQRGDLIIVAGRPSMGKTTLAVNIAENVVFRSELPVAIFSMEMGADQLVNRIVSSQGRINAQRLRTGRLSDDEWQAFSETVQRIEEKPLYIDDSSNLTITDLCSRARRLVTKVGPLGLIVVDYIQLMRGLSTKGGDNRNSELSEISRGLKALAKELNCPVICLSQLNRSVDSRDNKRPLMSDLRESGAIEQDADVIMFIYREWVYNKEQDPKRAEVIVRKQRNGPVGTLLMSFTGENTRFETAVGEVGYMKEE